jgi:DNA invertase Pin-like site-specific DNA recombinase
MSNYIAYYRCSTKSQSVSGLGIEAQQEAVKRHLKVGDTIVASFTETESGRNNARPQLQAALRLCRHRRGVLLIAKLDRLSRNVAFLATLLEGDVQVIACDNPTAERFTLHILAAVAEHEAKMISHRTKAALQAAKARGVVLGGWKGKPMLAGVRTKGCAVQASAARENAIALAPALAELRASGIVTTPALANALNQRAIPTPRGGKWHSASVARVLHRLAA